jgi:phage minor structural protein
MYQVTLREYPNSVPIVIHNAFTDGVKLMNGNISQGVNNIDSFDFEIHFGNEGYGKLHPMQSLMEIRNIFNNNLEFSGRLVTYSDTMTSDGMHSKTAVCEGVLGYLHDSHPDYVDFSGTPEELFELLIGYHNGLVEDYKQLYFGTVALNTKIDRDGNVLSIDSSIPSTNYVAFITPENTVFDTIKTNLLDVYGGEIQIRTVGDTRYIDYVQSIGHDSQEDINISHNLRSVTKKVDPSKIVTRLIPLGNIISTKAENDNERRLTIASVNDNKTYLDRTDLMSTFGNQVGSVIFDNVDNATTLKSKGIDWLNKQKIVLQQFTLEAIDLFKIGKGVEEYIVGNTHKIINPIMTLDERIRIVNKTVDIVNPINSSLTIGDKFKSLIEYQVEQRNAEQTIANLQYRLSRQGVGVNSISVQLSDIQNTLTNSSVDTLPLDLESINAQLDQISSDLNALPSYTVATTTSDGLMSSTDKDKTDKITVTTAVDLDDLVARIIALENGTT